MNEELEQKLYDDFPLIFEQRHLGIRYSAMAWGLQCGDGWFDIIWNLCEFLSGKIEFYNKLLDEEFHENEVVEFEKACAECIRFTCVKEKFGVLRIYTDRDEYGDVFSFVEFLSSKTCETCGKPGELVCSERG